MAGDLVGGNHFMNQNAIVKRAIDAGTVQVSLLRQVECGLSSSGSCEGCPQKPKEEILALAENPIGAVPGDKVEVEPTAGNSIGIAVLVYLLPCIFLGVGYILGQAAGLGEMAAVGAGAVGLVVGFLPAVLVNRSLTRRTRPEFVILKHLDS